jgi:hypothetical protein
LCRGKEQGERELFRGKEQGARGKRLPLKVKVKNEKCKIIHCSLLLLHFIVIYKLINSQTHKLINS